MAKKHSALSSLAKGSSKMAIATLISRFLGLIREQVMASLFGASGMSDAFFIAYRIPNLLRGLFAEGAFSSAFVPTFIQAREEGGDEKANHLLWRVFLKLGVLTFVLSALVVFYSESIVSLFVSDIFQEDTMRFELAVKLTQVMAPYLCLTSLAAVFMGALNSFRSYFIPALAPAIFNIFVIASALLLPAYLEIENPAIFAISYGIVIGGFMQLLFQVPKLFKMGLKPTGLKKEVKTFNHEMAILRKMGPGILGTAAQHVNLLVSTVLATGSALGAVSWLTYAFRLFQFPVGVIGVSIGNSFLVEFSESVKQDEMQRAKTLFKSSQSFSLFLLLPITIIGFLGANSLVSIVFERGLFDQNSVEQTSIALKYYLLGLPLFGYYKTLNASLYAVEKAKIPVLSSAIAISVSMLISWLYIDEFGFGVLALSNALTFLINIIIMAWAMKYYFGWGITQYVNKESFKLVALACLIAVAGYFVYPQNIASSFGGHILYMIALSLSVFILWAGGCYALGRRRFFTRN